MTTQTSTDRKKQYRMISIGIGFAILWWLIILIGASKLDIVAWIDQRQTFTMPKTTFSDPYMDANFSLFQPPWVVLFIIPFKYLPIELATLIQSLILFVSLALVVIKYDGNERTLVVILSSVFGFDSLFELNLEWIVCLGLLVPKPFSGIFLAIKPQILPGYFLTFKLREFLLMGLVTASMILMSFIIWGINYPQRWYEVYSNRSIIWSTSIAPFRFMPWYISVILGTALLVFAYRRKDNLLIILSMIFFTPYLPTYSAIVPFAIFALRFPRIAEYTVWGTWLLTISFFVITFNSGA